MRGVFVAVLAGVLAASSTAAAQMSDVELAMSVDNSAPEVGTDVTFTITMTNQGPDATIELGILHQLPPGLTFVSATPSSGFYTEQDATWSLVSIAAGNSETLQIVATPAAEGTYLHTAEVLFADLPDPDSTPGNGNDQEDDWAQATITAGTATENQPPVAYEATFDLVGGEETDLFVHADDPDGDPLVYEVLSVSTSFIDISVVGPEPNHLRFWDSGSPSDTFTFVFAANDGLAQSNEATCTVNRTYPGHHKKVGDCEFAIVPGAARHGVSLLGLLAVAVMVALRRRRPR